MSPFLKWLAMSATSDKFKGKVKEAVGKVTGNTDMEAEGKTDKAKGAVKSAVGDAAGVVKGAANSVKKETKK
jgi:uncharacterized protein YjbJ (UPF0337 family)